MLLGLTKLDALWYLVPFALFKKREKHPWSSVSFSNVAGLLKVTLHHWCFSRLLNQTNGTKSRKAYFHNWELYPRTLFWILMRRKTSILCQLYFCYVDDQNDYFMIRMNDYQNDFVFNVSNDKYFQLLLSYNSLA